MSFALSFAVWFLFSLCTALSLTQTSHPVPCQDRHGGDHWFCPGPRGVGVEGPRLQVGTESLFPSSCNSDPFHCSGLPWSPLALDSPSSLPGGPGIFWPGLPPPGHTAPYAQGGADIPWALWEVLLPPPQMPGLAGLSGNSRGTRTVMGRLPKNFHGPRLCLCEAHTSVAGSWRPGLLASGRQAGPVLVHHGSVSGLCSSQPQQPSVAA